MYQLLRRTLSLCFLVIGVILLVKGIRGFSMEHLRIELLSHLAPGLMFLLLAVVSWFGSPRLYGGFVIIYAAHMLVLNGWLPFQSSAGQLSFLYGSGYTWAVSGVLVDPLATLLGLLSLCCALTGLVTEHHDHALA